MTFLCPSCYSQKLEKVLKIIVADLGTLYRSLLRESVTQEFDSQKEIF
jgi:hypothetical protein